MASRQQTLAANRPVAVGIVAVLKYADKESEVALTIQFRPPIGKHCVEFPAGIIRSKLIALHAYPFLGLVDGQDSVEETALRELRVCRSHFLALLDSKPMRPFRKKLVLSGSLFVLRQSSPVILALRIQVYRSPWSRSVVVPVIWFLL